MILKSIEHLLSKENFYVASARNGQEAIDYLDKIHFDVVVTDLMMPHVTGRELINRIRKDPNKAYIKIIVVSTISGEMLVNEAFNAGADDYLTKPFMGYELLLRIKKLLPEDHTE